MSTVRILSLVISLGSVCSVLAMNKSLQTWSDDESLQLMDDISRENSKGVAAFNSSVNFRYVVGLDKLHSPLSYAVARGSKVIIGILLAKGATLDDLTIREVKRINDASIGGALRAFFQEDYDKAFLESEEWQAAAEGALEEIDYEEINMALSKGDLGVLHKALTTDNFNPNKKFTAHNDSDGFGNPLTIHGTTLFIQAAAFGNVEAMHLLVKAGADIYATTSNGWTALHGAATHGRVEAARYLLKLTKDNPVFIRLKDNLTGATAIQAAFYFKKYEVRNLLLGI